MKGLPIKHYTKNCLYVVSFPFFLCLAFFSLRKVPATPVSMYLLHTSIVFRHRFFKTMSLPNLVKPESFNDKIAWLMIFDQDPRKIALSDKIEVKHWISHIAGDYYPATIKVFDSLDEISREANQLPCVIKTNHDSGSVFILRKTTDFSLHTIAHKIGKKLKQKYGISKGEWPYQYIRPLAFREEHLGDAVKSPSDYKFHCCDGEISFVQYIYDRDISAKEVIMDRRGRDLCIHFDEKFAYGNPPKITESWWEMCQLARKLSKSFCYVRVDLYLIDSTPMVGELTFYPRAGCYIGNGQRKLGSYLTIDHCQRREAYKPGR